MYSDTGVSERMQRGLERLARTANDEPPGADPAPEGFTLQPD